MDDAECLRHIVDFLQYAHNRNAPLVLKGGTALLLGYGLPRLSGDIDLDSFHPTFSTVNLASAYAKRLGYRYTVSKNTSTVQRLIIHCSPHPIRVEVSYRSASLNIPHVVLNGIKIYDLPTLASFKASALSARDTTRDIYDVCFIINNYWNTLPDDTKLTLYNALFYKDESLVYRHLSNPEKYIDAEDFYSQYVSAMSVLGLPH